eukprot:8207892-Pyramimonas_sp.AAC.1
METLGSAMGPLGLLKRTWERQGTLESTCGSFGAPGNTWEHLGALGSVLGACRERLGACRCAW